MMLGGFLCGSSWLVYGMLLNDPNVYVSVNSNMFKSFKENGMDISLPKPRIVCLKQEKQT